jgi:hypothetical protein
LKKRRNQFDPSTRHSVENLGSSGTKCKPVYNVKSFEMVNFYPISSLVSITENSSIDEFLSNAEAAQVLEYLKY